MDGCMEQVGLKPHPFLFLFSLLFILPTILLAQEKTVAPVVKQQGKYDSNKFSQMYDLLATPNMFRTASGAPGPASRVVMKLTADRESSAPRVEAAA